MLLILQSARNYANFCCYAKRLAQKKPQDAFSRLDNLDQSSKFCSHKVVAMDFYVHKISLRQVNYEREKMFRKEMLMSLCAYKLCT